jgi:hypothetical protein
LLGHPGGSNKFYSFAHLHFNIGSFACFRRPSSGLFPQSLGSECLVNGLQQGLLAKWLDQDIPRPSLKHLHMDALFFMRRDEDNRDFGMMGNQLLVELNATLAWHPHVEYKAVRFLGSFRTQVRFR